MRKVKLFIATVLLTASLSMTALAGLVKPYLTELMIVRMSCIGSILIFGLGLNLVLGSKIKIGNLLPAVFLPLLVCLLGF